MRTLRTHGITTVLSWPRDGICSRVRLLPLRGTRGLPIDVVAFHTLRSVSTKGLVEIKPQDEPMLVEFVRRVDGLLAAPGNVIRHHGKEIRRAELPGLLTKIKKQHRETLDTIHRHDRAVHTAHRAAAKLLSEEWERYLTSLVSLLHYAEHVSTDLLDARDFVHHEFLIVTADGRVTQAEMQRLEHACNTVHFCLEQIFSARSKVQLPPAVSERLMAADWSALLPKEFGLTRATPQALAQGWIAAMDKWVDAVLQAFSGLRNHTLDVLLETERQIEADLRARTVCDAPEIHARVPREYARCRPQAARPRQQTLGWWDRFQLADGWGPGTMRAIVALGVRAASF